MTLDWSWLMLVATHEFDEMTCRHPRVRRNGPRLLLDPDRQDGQGQSRLMLVAIHEFDEMALDWSSMARLLLLHQECTVRSVRRSSPSTNSTKWPMACRHPRIRRNDLSPPSTSSMSWTPRTVRSARRPGLDKLIVTSKRDSSHGALLTGGLPGRRHPQYHFHKAYNTTVGSALPHIGGQACNTTVSHLAREASSNTTAPRRAPYRHVVLDAEAPLYHISAGCPADDTSGPRGL
ncbi:NACHT and Ankyrin domain-containing protein [Lasiodiplodia theobromae]|uniref:NACHT and Ankyrin domain-containing protein n=1 Tax=Lasiodiplodia theobromae TaxID=45133 RepID=UPI0015C343AD|nr:NACHT and Ankyrin domain-containing protein [Lasiodiplodia theobromae]KAF4546389.1 NACHT and Ankyrin domain-containing protein [Lasiodiplodia theobromae]